MKKLAIALILMATTGPTWSNASLQDDLRTKLTFKYHCAEELPSTQTTTPQIDVLDLSKCEGNENLENEFITFASGDGWKYENHFLKILTFDDIFPVLLEDRSIDGGARPYSAYEIAVVSRLKELENLQDEVFFLEFVESNFLGKRVTLFFFMVNEEHDKIYVLRKQLLNTSVSDYY